MASGKEILKKDSIKGGKGKRVKKPVKSGSRSYAEENLSSSSEVQEGFFTYWLGLSSGKNIRTGFDIISISKEGISKNSIDRLTTHLGITKKSMAEDILGISVKTLERKSSKEKLDKRSSSHAVEIARLMQHAYMVFRDEESVKKWLNMENRALNFKKPVSLLDTLTGLSLVNDILGRIEEGVYS